MMMVIMVRTDMMVTVMVFVTICCQKSLQIFIYFIMSLSLLKDIRQMCYYLLHQLNSRLNEDYKVYDDDDDDDQWWLPSCRR